MNVADLRADPSNMPRIGADNVFRQGVITASSGTGRYAVDWRADRVWAPDTGTATIEVELDEPAPSDYFFLAFHNLDAADASVLLQRWNGATWANVFSAIIPADNEPIWRSFDAEDSTRWRVVITATGEPAIGILAVGQAIELEEGIQPGWAPPIFAASGEVIDSVSEKGLLIGRTLLRRPDETTLALALLSDGWMRTYWRPVRERLIRQPWALCWSPEEDDGGAALCWTDGMPPPDAYDQAGFQRISWPIKMVIGRDVAADDTVQEVCPVTEGDLLAIEYSGYAIVAGGVDSIVVDADYLELNDVP